MLQLRTRKTLGTVLDLLTKLSQSPKEFIESRVWFEVVQLESIASLNKLMPLRFVDVRNIF